MFYRGVHDADAMRAQRVCNVLNVDRVQVLVVAVLLNENLIVQIVQIFGHKMMNVAHDFQHIEPLFERLRGQMIFDGVQVEFMAGVVAHLAVRAPIVHRNRR